MIKSMTGFGRASLELDGRSLMMDIRSVNNRYFDLQVRCPDFLRPLELQWRQQIQKTISRGKIDLKVFVLAETKEDTTFSFNREQAAEAASVLKELSSATGLPTPGISTLLQLVPDLLRGAESSKEEQWKDLCAQTLEQCLEKFDGMRQLEGKNLQADILSRLDEIEAVRHKLAQRAPDLPELYREKLNQRIEQLLQTQREEYYDGQRIAAEVAIFADKVDFQEELVRLGSHLSQMKELLSSKEPAGKKADFLIQEMNRETNTIGSKCNDLNCTQWVLDLKTEIEQIREQIQNIE